MNYLKTMRIMAVALLITGSGAALAQQTGTARTEILRHDLDGSGREIIQVRVDLAPGTTFARHSHPGVEIAHVLKGTIEYQFDGEAPVTLKAGDSLFIPAGTVHSGGNVGNGEASELATYLVPKDKPIVQLAK